MMTNMMRETCTKILTPDSTEMIKLMKDALRSDYTFIALDGGIFTLDTIIDATIDELDSVLKVLSNMWNYSTAIETLYDITNLKNKIKIVKYLISEKRNNIKSEIDVINYKISILHDLVNEKSAGNESLNDRIRNLQQESSDIYEVYNKLMSMLL